MEPVVIEETTLATYYNFVEFQPTINNNLIEVICYEGGTPIDTFDIFRGTVFDNSTIAIVLASPVTKVSVVNGAITDFGLAPLDDDDIVTLFQSEHQNIRWKEHIPPMPQLPKRTQEAASEPIEKPTTPKQVKLPVTESPVSVISPFGGKTKKRKSRKKLKRKSTKVRIGKRLP